MPSSKLVWAAWLALVLCTGCSVGNYDPQWLAYRQRLELGVATPEDTQRFKTPHAEQQELVSSAQEIAPVADGASEVQLRAAAAAGNTVSVKALLTSGAQANGTDPWGNTPLLLAAQAGHTEAVRQLIKAGALVDGRDGAMTPLAAAALRGHVATVRMLISNGADINAPGLGGQAPLLLAVKLNRLEVATVLLNAGASIAIADRSDYSLLMVAVNENYPDMLSLLLSKGVNPNQADSSGLPPLYWTELLKLDDLSRRLRDAGGRNDKQAARAALGAPFETGGY